jgi:hypothetical protein
MQLFGYYVNILSFVRIIRLNWVGYVKTIDGTIKVNKAFNNTLQGSRLRGRPRNRWWNCVQTDNNKCKIKNLKWR